MENPAVNINPWKGLNFYKEGEIIYGRNSEIESLSQYILNNTQTVLYGKSGIGKSSILNAGVFPIARQHGLIPVGIRLDHSKSVSYIRQIENAIVSSGVDVHEIQPAISENSETLWEYLHRNIFFDKDGNRSQLLLVLDQFEEIFTLQKDEKKKLAFFDELADLINDVTPLYIVNANKSQLSAKDGKAKEVEGSLDDFEIDLDIEEVATEPSTKYLQKVDYHVVFTLREDFLSFLERYTKFIPVMKSNRYALLPLNEEQAAEIIMKPRKGLVEQDVAKLIIQKVTGGTDFSLGDEPEIDVDAAILSLYLSRIYVKKKESDAIITAELVNQFSDDIIKDFYEESVADIPIAEIEKIEDQLLTYDGRRNNVSRNDLVSEGISESVIDTLVDDKKLLRQFSYQNDIRVEFMHDILCPVVDARINQREETKRKEEERQRQEEEKQRILLEEKTKREKIEREAEEERNRLKEEAKRIQRRNRRRMRAFATLIVAVGVIGFVVFLAKFKSYSEFYGNYTIVNGWPEGLGEELNNVNDGEKLIVHYRLIRKGWLPQKWGGRPFERVEVVDAGRKSCTNKFYETPVVGLLETEMDDIKAKAFATLQRKTAYWVFTPGGSGFEEGAVRCTAYNLDKEELYSIQYYRDKTYVSQDSTKYVQWAVFNDVNGKQMMVTDNGVDRMRQTIKNGVVTGCLFFTELGTPQKNAYDAYGYQYEVNDTTYLIKRQYCVDKFGAKIDSTAIDFLTFEYGRVNQTSLYKVFQPQKGCIVYEFNDYKDTLLFNMNGTLGYGTFHTSGGKYSRIIFKYDNQGLPILNQKYESDTLTESRKYSYLNHTRKMDSIVVLQNGITFTEKYSYPNDTTIEISFWKDGSQYSLWHTNEFGDSLFYHKSITKQSTDSLRIEVEYQDNLCAPISYKGVIYSSYSRMRDNKNKKNVKLEYFYDADGEICKSEWFDYDEYGNRIARAVAGVDGTPVRCPNWDWDNLCYYKMAFLKNFGNNVFIALKGLNEFGEHSYIVETMNNENFLFDLFELPLEKLYKDSTKGKIRTRYFGLSVAQNNRSHYSIREVPYLHILSAKGTIYETVSAKSCQSTERKRMKDGDIICKIGAWHLYDSPSLLKKEWDEIEKKGGNIDLLQKSFDGYNIISFHINAGVMGAEYHYMPLTELEQNRINLNNKIK